MNYRNILLIILSASFIATFMSCNKGRATQSSAVHVQRQTKKVIYPSPKDSVTNRHQISLVPSNTWIYNYNDGYFPCDTTCDLVLKGFAVDTNQHFYILGGNPTYIALYQDTILLKKMFLGTHLDDSYDALMQITNDSIYYIDEQNKIVYSLNKELEGSVNSFNLPFDLEDSIVSGKMEHDSYYILTQKKDSEGWKSENYTTWCLEYPNIIKKIYHKKICMYDEVPGYCRLQENNDAYFYHGLMEGYKVFLTPPEYDNCTILLVNDSGECIYKDSIKGLPPIAAVSGYEMHYGALQTPNLRVIAKDKLYLTGYDYNIYQFYILEYQIKKQVVEKPKEESINPTPTSSEIDSIAYYYYYSNYPSYDCEDNIIEFLYKNGEVVDGYFWGTSDEFRDAREGFYPGFFVLRLEQISNKNDSIVFTLDSRNTQYFSAPVSISYHSSDEALKHGYHPWIQNDKFFQDSISFCGTFQNDNFILHKEKSKYSHIVDRHFVRISPDSLKNIEYQCSFEEENRAINNTPL